MMSCQVAKTLNKILGMIGWNKELPERKIEKKQNRLILAHVGKPPQATKPTVSPDMISHALPKLKGC